MVEVSSWLIIVYVILLDDLYPTYDTVNLRGGGVDKTLIECKTIVHLMHVYWSVASTKND